MKEYVIISDGLPIGFFGDKQDAINALKYCKQGVIYEKVVM